MIYPPPTCYKCGAWGPGVAWRELGPREAIPTCERHKPMLVAMRDLNDACADAMKALGESARRAGESIAAFFTRYRDDE